MLLYVTLGDRLSLADRRLVLERANKVGAEYTKFFDSPAMARLNAQLRAMQLIPATGPWLLILHNGSLIDEEVR